MKSFERDEIIIKYAELLGDDFDKTAADVVDYAQVMAIEVPVALIGDVALGGALIGGKAMLSGVGLAHIPAWLAGAGIKGMLAATGGPIGIILGIALGVGVAIWQASKQTDDNIDDLVSRLEALDVDDESTQAFIDNWIANLKAYKPALALAPTTTDPRERAKFNRQKLDGMTALNNYLVQMQRDWPRLEARLTDWAISFDPGQAKTAIDKTLVTMQQGLQQIIAATRKSVQEFIAVAGKEKQRSYPEIAKGIQDSWNELSKMHGGDPTFDSAGEKAGYELANSIVRGDTKIENFDANFGNMVTLYSQLQEGLKKSKAAQPKPLLSKRALTYPDGTNLMPPGVREGVPGISKRQKGRGRLYGVTIGIQKAINRLAAIYLPKMSRIREDGIYGPQTGGSLSGLITAMPGLKNALARQAGVTQKTAQDYKQIRRNPNLLSSIYEVISPLVGAEAEGAAGTEARRPRRREEPDNYKRTPCPLDKEKLTSAEIDSCLRQMDVPKVKSSDKYQNAYEFLTSYGFNTPEKRFQILWDALFAGSAAGLQRPAKWLNWGPTLVRYVVNKYEGKHLSTMKFLT